MSTKTWFVPELPVLQETKIKESFEPKLKTKYNPQYRLAMYNYNRRLK